MNDYNDKALEEFELHEEKRGGDLEKGLKYGNMMTAYAQDAGDLASAHYTRFQIQVGRNLEAAIEEGELAIKSLVQPKNFRPSDKGKNFREHFTGVLEECRCQLRVQKKANEREEKKLEERRERVIPFTRDLFTLQSPNPLAPALEDFVEIKYNEKKGRHLVVTKDVEAGKSK